MQILGKLLRALVLLIGLALVVGGLFCGTLGLTDGPLLAEGALRFSGVFVIIGLAAITLGGLLIFFMVRSFNRRGGAVQPAKDDFRP
jgi:hypothetical protein